MKLEDLFSAKPSCYYMYNFLNHVLWRKKYIFTHNYIYIINYAQNFYIMNNG